MPARAIPFRAAPWGWVSMIQAVLWDFGGVLTTSPFDAFNAFEAERGMPRDFIRGINATNPEHNAWARLESSAITLAQFNAEFEAESGAAGHPIPELQSCPS